jgi:hypothetical protein
VAVPTWIVAVTRPVAWLIRETEALFEFATQIEPKPATSPFGEMPTRTVCTTRLVLGLTRCTVFCQYLATHTAFLPIAIGPGFSLSFGAGGPSWIACSTRPVAMLRRSSCDDWIAPSSIHTEPKAAFIWIGESGRGIFALIVSGCDVADAPCARSGPAPRAATVRNAAAIGSHRSMPDAPAG